jgi:hypothetical protein
MSDGPHRSLPMRRGWRKVAECGANQAFEPEEVAERVAPALEGDCRDEMTSEFLDAFYELYHSLFRENFESELDNLRDMAGLGMGRVLLDMAAQLAACGETGPDAPVKALTNMLMDHAGRCSKQVEEHWLRESTERRARDVRGRVDDGIKRASVTVERLARKLLKIDPGSPPRPQKQQGLDDGVKL